MTDLLKITKNLYENDLQRKEIESIFNVAQNSRKGSHFKKEISANDLIQKWKDNRFPTDIRDIVNILKSAKFSPREINKVFKKAGYGSADNPAISPAMERISKYIIKQGYTEDILKFLKDNYSDLEEIYVADGNIVIEDIRSIFNEIVKEDRPDLQKYIQQEQKLALGRNKK